MESRSRAILIAGPTATADMRPRGQSYSPRRFRGPNWLTRFWRRCARCSARSTRAAAACASSGMLLMASPASSDATDDALAAMRAGSEKYRDVNAALAAGYIREPDEPLLHRRDDGHARRLGRDGRSLLPPRSPRCHRHRAQGRRQGRNLDFENPSILIYEPEADGGLELVAIENLVFEAAWQAAGNDAPPTLLGRTWDTMADDPRTPSRRGPRVRAAL